MSERSVRIINTARSTLWCTVRRTLADESQRAMVHQ
jgi:hypothetical protein